jgi:hypothetical protein
MNEMNAGAPSLVIGSNRCAFRQAQLPADAGAPGQGDSPESKVGADVFARRIAVGRMGWLQH